MSRCPSTLVVASRNAGKVREIQQLLGDLGVRVLSLGDFPDIPDVPEPHDTFIDNATEKAVAVARATGQWALADDSGLCVDALASAPGVRSARIAPTDPERIAWLLSQLADVPPSERTARFVCAVAIAAPSGEVLTCEGTAEGMITDAPRGEGGFGYDPVFLVPDRGRTFAELTPQDKNAISHRGRALRQAREALARFLRDCDPSAP